MNIHTLFDDKSEIYAQARPRYPTALYTWLSGVCSGHQAVWDVGCGSGQAAVDLRGIFDEVQATDVSSSQIESAPVYEGVTFSVQPAESTRFADDAFDAVCAAQALHWFDYEQFWPEVKRVLKPRGVFAAWGYSWPHVNPTVDQRLDDSLLSLIRPLWASQNQLLWNGYKDVPFPFTRLDVLTFELTVSWSLEQFFAYMHSWSATRRYMEQHGDAFFEESFQRLAEVWQPQELRDVSMDFVVIAGTNPDAKGAG